MENDSESDDLPSTRANLAIDRMPIEAGTGELGSARYVVLANGNCG